MVDSLREVGLYRFETRWDAGHATHLVFKLAELVVLLGPQLLDLLVCLTARVLQALRSVCEQARPIFSRSSLVGGEKGVGLQVPVQRTFAGLGYDLRRLLLGVQQGRDTLSCRGTEGGSRRGSSCERQRTARVGKKSDSTRQTVCSLRVAISQY